MSNLSQEMEARRQMEAFDDFVNAICKAVEAAMLRDHGRHVETELRDVTKTNGVTLEGMTVIMKDDDGKDICFEGVYLNQWFDKSQFIETNHE